MPRKNTQSARRKPGRPTAREALKHRINAGKAAVEDQIDFFHKQFGQVKSEWKEDDTRVTFADFAISEKIFATLRMHFPNDDYCSEESNPLDEVLQLEAEYAWVLDPIDGTNNFAMGMPLAAISLALLKDGVPVYGILYDSNRHVILHGGPGMGVYEDRNRLRPKFREAGETESSIMKDFTIGLHFPILAERINQFEPLLTQYRIRSLGSGALNLAYAAIGYYDGSIDFKVKVWDIAAAYAIAQETGREFHFIEAPAFPLKTFHPRMGRCPYYSGSPYFCRKVESML